MVGPGETLWSPWPPLAIRPWSLTANGLLIQYSFVILTVTVSSLLVTVRVSSKFSKLL
jgi:hypothetical protein